jgi:hypothetical protein
MIFVAEVQMKSLTHLESELHEVFRTGSGAVFQSDKERCLYLHFGGKKAKFKYSCLLRLKKAIEAINVEHMLINTEGADIEIISIHGCDHCYILTPLEIIALRELLQGTFVMFQLNLILKDCLHRLVV